MTPPLITAIFPLVFAEWPGCPGGPPAVVPNAVVVVVVVVCVGDGPGPPPDDADDGKLV